MTDDVRRAARRAEAHPALRGFARGGYVATGVVHILIGAFAVALVFGSRGEADQAGALKAIAAAPLGFAVLWVLAALLWGLAAWQALDGIAAGSFAKLRPWGRRLAAWGQAIVFAALGVIAAGVALGARPRADETAEEASRGVLALPGGPLLLGAVGLGVGIAGIAFIVMGVRRSFRTKLDLPDGAVERTVTVLGVVGFVAKGIALAIVGVLLLVTAVRADPQQAGGLDAAVQALLGVFAGPFLVAAVGAGLAAYGVFCLFRARYATL